MKLSVTTACVGKGRGEREGLTFPQTKNQLQLHSQTHSSTNVAIQLMGGVIWKKWLWFPTFPASCIHKWKLWE